MARLEALNQLDLRLWAHATQLVSRRYSLASDYYSALGPPEREGAGEQAASRRRCAAENGRKLPGALEKHLGIFRPPGHKGPL